MFIELFVLSQENYFVIIAVTCFTAQPYCTPWPGADWPLGALGRFPVAWQLIWLAALCFYFVLFFLLLFLPSQYAKLIIYDCGIP